MESKAESGKSRLPIGIHKNGKPIKVVVIDDTFIDRRIMSQILRSTGFDVVGEADNGIEGLEIVENERPHLVILDYVMPKMNGMSVLKKIKTRDPSVSVIMSTSESDRELAIDLIKNGAKDYILKPLDRKLIVVKLKKVVLDLASVPKTTED